MRILPLTLLAICSLFVTPLYWSQSTLTDTSFIALKTLSPDFVYDLRYATENNFTKQKIYDCAECYVRSEVAKALILANQAFQQKGLKIKFYDCYRPLDIQKKMWAIYPDARYVANPNKGGSMHNKGGAVDITLVDSLGNELPMGTAFDHFGIEAHHGYNKLPKTVIENRKLLKTTMEQHGFRSITTEWWHYDFQSVKKYPNSNFPVKCQ